MAAKVAAKILERSVSAFNARFVKTNAVAIAYVDGDRTRYFRKSEVEELAGRMKTLLRPSDVWVCSQDKPESTVEVSKSRSA